MCIFGSAANTHSYHVYSNNIPADFSHWFLNTMLDDLISWDMHFIRSAQASRAICLHFSICTYMRTQEMHNTPLRKLYSRRFPKWNCYVGTCGIFSSTYWKGDTFEAVLTVTFKGCHFAWTASLGWKCLPFIQYRIIYYAGFSLWVLLYLLV